jgi:hypothetical protein
MNVSGNLPPGIGGGPRVVEVGGDDACSGVPVCTTAPRIEEPDDQGAIVEHRGAGGPAGATTEKLSTADYVARNRLILLVGAWPEIKERIVGETNELLGAGMSYSAVHCAEEKLVQEAAPGIRAKRAEKVELVRRGVLSPDEVDGATRDLAAEKKKTDVMRAETDVLRDEADAAEVRAGIRGKKKVAKGPPGSSGRSSGKCNPA